jgi:uncharacterized damage-inducible protein DinB
MKTILLVFFLASFGYSQVKIEPQEGYSPQLGGLVSMLEDLKNRITNNIQNLNENQTDFLMDDKANRIGALILHLAATEKFYQNVTFESREFNKEEKKIWQVPFDLGDKARLELQGKSISYYLEIWDEVRTETLRLLKGKDDNWLMEKAGKYNMNNYWAWFHVMEHQANHMGQMAMIFSRMPKNNN